MSESDREESANIEEVMASIRKAIEEEAGEEAEGQAHSPLEPHVRAPQEGRTDADSGVIHLTRMVTSDGEVVDLREQQRLRETIQSAEPVARPPDPAPDEAAQELQQEPQHEPQQEPQQDNLGAVDPIKAAGAAAITKYLTEHPPHVIEQGPQLGGGQSLESVVRQALVPHVREWLEANLAPLVHNIVREEIEQMVRRRKDE